MTIEEKIDLKRYQFRGLHPNIFIGMASDRYAGWIGQIYSGGRYTQGMAHRTHKVGERSFVEEVLPVESVEEYFEHFPILGIDYTFYRPLLDKNGKPTPLLGSEFSPISFCNRSIWDLLFLKNRYRKGRYSSNHGRDKEYT